MMSDDIDNKEVKLFLSEWGHLTVAEIFKLPLHKKINFRLGIEHHISGPGDFATAMENCKGAHVRLQVEENEILSLVTEHVVVEESDILGMARRSLALISFSLENYSAIFWRDKMPDREILSLVAPEEAWPLALSIARFLFQYPFTGFEEGELYAFKYTCGSLAEAFQDLLRRKAFDTLYKE